MEDGGEEERTASGEGRSETAGGSAAGSSNTEDNLTVLYTNCQSLIKKLDELKVVAADTRPDFICLTETWTNQQHRDGFLKVPGYKIICCYDREDTQAGCGGGLLIYGADGVCIGENVSTVYQKFNQCCAVKLPLVGGKFLELVLVYRPHKLYDNNESVDNNAALINVIKFSQPFYF